MSLKTYLNQVFSPPIVKNSEWISEEGAAKKLGISRLHLEFILTNQHLDPAKNTNGEKGVTRKSLAREMRWRNKASGFQKARRLIGDVLSWPLP